MSQRNNNGVGNFGNGLCISGNCGGNNVRDTMDSTDGATTWDGTITGDGASAANGPIIVPNRQPPPLPNLVGPTGPTVSASKSAGSEGLTLGARVGTAGTIATAVGDTLELGEIYAKVVGLANDAEKLHAAGQRVTLLALVLDVAKLRLDLNNPNTTGLELAGDVADITITSIAFRTKNPYIIGGAILYDGLSRQISQIKPGCDSICEINNNINLLQAAPSLSPGVPFPGPPGP